MRMYSALHIMQWFSHILDVFTPKIIRNFFDFNIFVNQNKRRLHKTCSDRSKQRSAQQVEFITGVKLILLLPPLSSSSKHGRRRSRLLLYSISMVKMRDQQMEQNVTESGTTRFLLACHPAQLTFTLIPCHIIMIIP